MSGRVARMGREQHANAVRILRDGAPTLRTVARKARMRYAVSLIVCDASGQFSMAEVEAGMAREDITRLAESLLREAGAW